MAVNIPLPEAAKVWGVSRRTAYRLADEGSIRVARFGRRMTVPAEEVERVRLEGAGEPLRAERKGAPVDLSPPRPGRRKRTVDRSAGTTGLSSIAGGKQ